METTLRDRALRIVLVAFGAVALLVYPLMHLWPAGFAWSPRQVEYEQMIAGLYATLGVFLLRAVRDPARHASLIWFTVWSSVVHGGIMAVQAAMVPMERMHLAGDVPLLLVAAAVLAALAPRTQR